MVCRPFLLDGGGGWVLWGAWAFFCGELRFRPPPPPPPPSNCEVAACRDGQAQQLGNLRGEAGEERDRRPWQGVLQAETSLLSRELDVCEHCRVSEAASRTVSVSRQMLRQVLLILEN